MKCYASYMSSCAGISFSSHVSCAHYSGANIGVWHAGTSSTGTLYLFEKYPRSNVNTFNASPEYLPSHNPAISLYYFCFFLEDQLILIVQCRPYQAECPAAD